MPSETYRPLSVQVADTCCRAACLMAGATLVVAMWFVLQPYGGALSQHHKSVLTVVAAVFLLVQSVALRWRVPPLGMLAAGLSCALLLWALLGTLGVRIPLLDPRGEFAFRRDTMLAVAATFAGLIWAQVHLTRHWNSPDAVPPVEADYGRDRSA